MALGLINAQIAVRNALKKREINKLYQGKEIFFFFGMRRSGNHACIQWLANSITQKNSPFIKDKEDIHFEYTDSCKVLFFNELNKLKNDNIYELFRKKKELIIKSKYIFISFEDFTPAELDQILFLPSPQKRIIIRRNILDLISSRYQNLVKKALVGQGWVGQSIDLTFFKRLSKLYKLLNKSNYLIWDFDLWQSDKKYRENFLFNLGFSVDIIPSITPHGGGSSFGANIEGDRLDKVFPQNEFKKFISVVIDEQKNLFSNDDLIRAENFLNK